MSPAETKLALYSNPKTHKKRLKDLSEIILDSTKFSTRLTRLPRRRRREAQDKRKRKDGEKWRKVQGTRERGKKLSCVRERERDEKGVSFWR